MDTDYWFYFLQYCESYLYLQIKHSVVGNRGVEAQVSGLKFLVSMVIIVFYFYFLYSTFLIYFVVLNFTSCPLEPEI